MRNARVSRLVQRPVFIKLTASCSLAFRMMVAVADGRARISILQQCRAAVLDDRCSVARVLYRAAALFGVHLYPSIAPALL